MMFGSICPIACSGLCQDVLVGLGVGLFTGVLASGLVLLGDRQRRRWQLSGAFKPLVGEYEHRDSKGEIAAGDWRSTIAYKDGGVLVTEAWSQTSEARWKGKVQMNERMPSFGMGMWQDTDGSSCGLHQFQVLDHDNIHVLWTLTSYNEGAKAENAVKWVRVGTREDRAEG